MLETFYAAIGAFTLGCTGLLCLVYSCYRAGYNDAKEGKKYNPTKHIRVEYLMK